MATKVVRSRGLLGLGGWERITWSGVFAGLVMMMVTQALLSVLGIAVGFTALASAQDAPGATFGWGAAIWAILSLSLSLFVGGYVAGRFAPTGTRANGAMNGALVWAVSFILGVYLVGTGMQTLTSGVFGVLGHATQANDSTQRQLEQLARRAGVDFDQLEREAERAAAEAAETARATGTSGTAENAQARQAADEAADYAAAGSWILLVGSIIGLGVASWAGGVGHGRGLRSGDGTLDV